MRVAVQVYYSAVEACASTEGGPNLEVPAKKFASTLLLAVISFKRGEAAEVWSDI
jgi:hypothetical protein